MLISYLYLACEMASWHKAKVRTMARSLPRALSYFCWQNLKILKWYLFFCQLPSNCPWVWLWNILVLVPVIEEASKVINNNCRRESFMKVKCRKIFFDIFIAFYIPRDKKEVHVHLMFHFVCSLIFLLFLKQGRCILQSCLAKCVEVYY